MGAEMLRDSPGDLRIFCEMGDFSSQDPNKPFVSQAQLEKWRRQELRSRGLQHLTGTNRERRVRQGHRSEIEGVTMWAGAGQSPECAGGQVSSTG